MLCRNKYITGYNLSGALDEFEGALKDGKVRIIGVHQLLAAHFLNVALKEGGETRKKNPVKIEQRARIDGFMNVIDAWTVRHPCRQRGGTCLRLTRNGTGLRKYYPEIGALIENEPRTPD